MGKEYELNRKKKILIRIITILLVFSLIPFPVLADEGWDGNTETQPQGTGTADDPYLIGTPEELAWYRSEINYYNNQACAKLTADIDLNNKPWTPIGQTITGQSSNAFAGEFDGGGYTICGLFVEHLRLSSSVNIDYGFFGTVKGVSSTVRASIHDLNLIGIVIHEQIAYVSATKGDAGGLCGHASNADIYGCTINVSVIVIEPDSVYGTPASAGGICGRASGVNITDCINYGDIKGSGSAGGLVGSGNASLIRCANYGNIEAGKGFAGGFLGYMKAHNGNESMTIRYCYNTGDVISTGKKDEDGEITIDMNAGGNAGGFIGYASFSNKNKLQYSFSHCFSTGTVSAPLHAGSIAGVLWDYATKTPSISFTDIVCLDISCSKVFGTNVNQTDIPLVVTTKTAEEMSSADYVTALNESAGYELFAAGDSCPVFKWLADAPSFKPGDINGDDMVDEQDVTLLIGHVLGLDILDSDSAAAADLNNDTYIDENDVTLLIQMVLP